MADYRPVINLETDEEILLNVEVECPAGWWMPLHSDSRFFDQAGRVLNKNLRQVDIPPPSN